MDGIYHWLYFSIHLCGHYLTIKTIQTFFSQTITKQPWWHLSRTMESSVWWSPPWIRHQNHCAHPVSISQILMWEMLGPGQMHIAASLGSFLCCGLEACLCQMLFTGMFGSRYFETTVINVLHLSCHWFDQKQCCWVQRQHWIVELLRLLITFLPCHL